MKRSQPNRVTILEFAWKGQGKVRNASVGVCGVPAENGTGHIRMGGNSITVTPNYCLSSRFERGLTRRWTKSETEVILSIRTQTTSFNFKEFCPLEVI
jgi:hypothetical protein